MNVQRTGHGYYNYVNEEGEKELTLSAGNSKTKCLCWSTLPGTKGTCYRNCIGCYGAKKYLDVPTVREMRSRNTKAAKGCQKEFSIKMNALVEISLKDLSPRHYRIHDVGDFDSVENFCAWRYVARCNPDAKFLGHTKRIDILSEFPSIKIPKIPNYTIIISIMPDMSERDLWKSIELSNKHNMPIAYSDYAFDYPLSIQEYLEGLDTIDCTYETCSQCNRICWNNELDCRKGIHFYRH